ncbi:N-acetyltransferase [Stenotrophomonas sp.]|uniref:GNAT family N-acetyltransferase n=1 Tax=Stenotrophomonas sp. TaxID=69392 RepID=UPI00289EAB85|nr:N-acetyltransferase [Stenotrophomonas sp.]
MQIRPERAQDIPVIHALTREAFADAPHRDGTEQDVLDALRAAGALSVSLVAEEGGALVGHVALSPVTLSDGSEDWYGLGPLSVAPAQQGRGVGSALMQAALAALEERGAAGCVLLGDPGYYGRFGFRADPRLRLAGVPPEYFQAVLLKGAWPDADVQYHAAFGG